MQRFESTSLWQEIDRCARNSRAKSVAIAYFTENGIGLREGDRLVVDASDRAVKSRQTDRELLTQLVSQGVRVFSFPGLHAKVMVFDSIAIVGSMNSSHSSRHHLQEAAIVSDELATVNSARFFIDQLIDDATRIDQAFLERLASLKLAKTTYQWPSKVGRSVKPNQSAPRTWVVGLYDTQGEQLSDHNKNAFKTGLTAAGFHQSKSDSRLSHFWLTGFYKMRKQARKSDLVIQIWRPTKDSKTPSAVYPPVPIRHIEVGERRTWFYVEDWADIERRSISWKRFKAIAGHARLSTVGRPIVPASIRLLSEHHYQMITSNWCE